MSPVCWDGKAVGSSAAVVGEPVALDVAPRGLLESWSEPGGAELELQPVTSRAVTDMAIMCELRGLHGAP